MYPLDPPAGDPKFWRVRREHPQRCTQSQQPLSLPPPASRSLITSHYRDRANRFQVIHLEGNLTLATVCVFTFEYAEVLATLTARVLLIDVSEVVAIDATGVGALWQCHYAARRQNTSVRLCGPNLSLLEHLRRQRLENKLILYSSREEALDIGLFS